MKKYLFLGLFVISLVAFISYKATHAYFSDTGQSTNNVFTASANFPQPTPQVADHLVISEVQTNGGTGGGQQQLTDRDFIELYNPTNSDINLNGYKLVKKTGSATPTESTIFTFNSSHNIPSHGFFLWASSESPGFADFIGSDASSSATIATTNNSIALKKSINTSEVVIDALSWSSISGSFTEGTRFSPDLDANQSMERKALSSSDVTSMTTGADVNKGNGYDSNNNSTDFILRTTSQPQNSSSPTETP